MLESGKLAVFTDDVSAAPEPGCSYRSLVMAHLSHSASLHDNQSLLGVESGHMTRSHREDDEPVHCAVMLLF